MRLGTAGNEEPAPGVAGVLPGPNDPVDPRVVALRAGAVVFVVALLPVLAWVPMRPDPRSVAVYLTGAAGLVAVAAGTAWFEAWRRRGSDSDDGSGTVWIIYGALLLADAGVASRTSGAGPAASGLDQLAAAAVAAWILWRTAARPEVRSARVSFGVIGATIAAGTGLVLGLHLLEAFAVPWTRDVPWSTLSDAVAGTGWVILAVWTVRDGRGREARPLGTPAALALVGAGVLARVPAPTDSSVQLMSSAVLLLAVSIALGSTMAGLRDALSAGVRYERFLRRTLARSREQALEEHERLEEWLHDVRNAVSGLRAADAVLREGGDRHPEERAELADAVSAELARLHQLVEPGAPRSLQDVALGDVVERAAAAERILGLRVHVAVGAIRVRAVPIELERAVRNVLTNARLHAHESAVRVEASERDGIVSVAIRDEGPGVPLEEQLAVFGRGWRGTTAEGSPGSGLGLHVTRQLLVSMGGEVRIVPETRNGCCVELTLRPATDTDRLHPLSMR